MGMPSSLIEVRRGFFIHQVADTTLGEANAVFPLPLGLINPAVGQFHQLLGREPGVTEGHPAADSDGEIGFAPLKLFDREPECFQQGGDLAHCRFQPKDQHQLFATVAAEPAPLVKQIHAQLAHPLEHHIPRLMTVGIVDPFEIIEIEHHQPERRATVELLLQALVEEAAVVEAGELVLIGLLPDLGKVLAGGIHLFIDLGQLQHAATVVGDTAGATGADQQGDLSQHAAEVAGPEQGQQQIENAGEGNHQLHVDGNAVDHLLHAGGRLDAEQDPALLGDAVVGDHHAAGIIEEEALIIVHASQPVGGGERFEYPFAIRMGQYQPVMVEQDLIALAQMMTLLVPTVEPAGEGGELGIQREHANPFAVRIFNHPGQRHGEGAERVVVIRIGPDHLVRVAGGQQIPGAGSGIELLVGLPGGVDQHLAMLGTHVDIIELHHLVISLPLLQVALAVADLRAAEILIIYLLINERKLAFERRQIGFDQGMEILGVASNQVLLLLMAQGAPFIY